MLALAAAERFVGRWSASSGRVVERYAAPAGIAAFET
jgi:hypothetical protein